MFSQFRQAVENLAPPPRHSSDGTPRDIHRDTASRSSSLDSPSRLSSPVSSSQLAESALVNLRRSFTQRSGGVGQAPRSAGTPRENRTKSTLEDRLRAAATFAIGDVSNVTSPDVSGKVSPSPLGVAARRPLSPSSTPLPESPVISPELGPTITSEDTFLSLPICALQEPPLELPFQPPVSTKDEQVASKDSPEVELPDTIAVNTFETTNPTQGSLDNTPVTPDGQNHVTSVEGLQERLKQVEQRFTGKTSVLAFPHQA